MPVYNSNNGSVEESKIQREMSCILSKNVFESIHNQRSLTPAIQSRWYRAPEIIVCHEDYDEKIDVWSVGCILGEMASVI